MLAGGVFANVKVNHSLKELSCVKKVFVQPQMGDGGLCLGAAALSIHNQKIKIKSLKNVYLGPSVDKNKISNLKEKYKKIKVKKTKNIIDEMCKDLKKNRVLGIVRGKMEFGPRALCNRSIIYKTSDVTISWLNKRMKRTGLCLLLLLLEMKLLKKLFLTITKMILLTTL